MSTILDQSIVPECVYLYSIKPSALKQLLYPDAISYKLEQARLLIAELYEVHRDNRDEERIAKVHKAISFNTKLLQELK